MRITKLKIFGFKSFAQKTEVTFPGNGLTAVVGPNGCGKSNIVDAIRWVLGEQRAAVLRMGKMQDVIFSGTEERAAMSMAEVSLVINNDQGDLPSEYSEVMVTRRAHRNGTSEYLINNQECRLKDIQNLFFDSGLGTGTYSQMNERMINAVLSDKAEDRRVLFEEAAGVSKYKQQRKETVRQLDRVRLDMERVEDNLRHARTSVRQYEKQAEKANEWKRLRTRLRELDLSVSLDRHEENKRSMTILNEARNRISHQQEADKTHLTTLEAKIEEKKLSISGEEDALRVLEMAVKQEELALNDMNNEIARYRDTLSTLTMTGEKYEGEVKDSKEKSDALHSERELLEEQMRRLGSNSELEARQRELAREQETLQVLRDACDDLRTKNRKITDDRLNAVNKVNSLRGRWQRIDAEVDMLSGNIEKWNHELADLDNQTQEAVEALKVMAQGIADAAHEIESLEERRTVQIEKVDSQKTELSAINRSLQEHENENTRLQSRVDVLRSMDVSSGADGAHWLLENQASFVDGLLGQEIDVNPEYVSQIEFALGESINAVITKNPGAVGSILDSLDKASAGSALLVVASDVLGTPVESLDNRPGVIGAANKFVKVAAPLRSFVDRLLSRWILVADFATALSFAREFAAEDIWFVAPGGRAVHTTGLVRGGHGASESLGLLSRRTEIISAEEKLTDLQSVCQSLMDSKERLAERIEEDENVLAGIMDSIREAQENSRRGLAAEGIHKNVLANLNRHRERLAKDIQQASERVSVANAERNTDQELATAEALASQLENEYQSLTAQLNEQDVVFRNKEEEVRDLQRELGSAQSLMTGNLSRIQSIQEQLKLHEDLIANRSSDIASIKTQMEELHNKETAVADRIENKNEELRKREVERDAARERYNVVSGDIEDWRSEVRVINASLLDRATELNDVERRIDSLGTNVDRMRERIFAEWEVDVDKPEGVIRVEYEEKEARREINDLQGKIKALGPINTGIMEDYDAEKARLADVEKQFDDLDRARASLERTIHKLDNIARDRFLDTFHKIQKNFQDVFSRLMHDGGTKLTLQEGVDPLEAEIEVNARPTGKKMRGVRALSGGERALTAVSLLFAIYMEKPSPYCVLDEVDGPLDDANIGRFMELLRHFSRQTQFILVTHNKRTMAASDMLYGVTQEIKGISRIASVKLDDAVGFAM